MSRARWRGHRRLGSHRSTTVGGGLLLPPAVRYTLYVKADRHP